MIRLALLALPAFALASCAAPGPSALSTELDAMIEECRRRGGVLTPLPGPPSGNQRADYGCEIRGASRIR